MLNKRKFLLILLANIIPMFLGCSGVFYFPSKEQVLNPSDASLAYRDIWIETPNEPKLHGWFLPAENPIATVIHLHGNAENISTHIASVYWMPSMHIQLLTVDYRGYGLSEGDTSLAGIQRDSERAITFASQMPEAKGKPLILYGQSLGGSMALYTVAKPEFAKQVNAVVSESAFADYHEIAQEKLASTWLTYPFQWPLKFLVSDKFSPIDVVDKIQLKNILLIHGTMDDTVPYHHAEELCAKIGSNCTLWRGEGAGHVQAFRTEGMRQKFVDFVKTIH